MKGIAVVVLVVGLGLVACGEDREESAQTGATERTEATGPPVATVDIRGVDFRLIPDDPRVERPGVVEFDFRNDGEAPHALEVEGPKGEAETKTLQPGGSAKLKVDLSEPGSYTMYCPVSNHRELGMEGKVTVAGAGGAGGGATETESGTTTGETITETTTQTAPDTTGTTEGGGDGGGSGSGSGGAEAPGGY